MLQFLADPAHFAVVAGVFGLIVGSFLNVVIHRLPIILERDWAAQCAEVRGEAAPVFEKLTLAVPRSRCPKCGHAISALENVPVLSWLALRGRCRGCAAQISWRYPAVEALTGSLFAWIATYYGFGPTALAAMLFAGMLIALTGIDLDTQLLPDDLTLPLLGLGIAGAGFGWTGVPLADAAGGAFAGYGGLWLLAYSYKKLRGVEGMGEGDFKLLAGLGALLGWQLLPSIVLLASAVGAVVGIGLIAFGCHKREVPIPFGTYLVGGGLAAMFFGRQLTAWWFPTL